MGRAACSYCRVILAIVGTAKPKWLNERVYHEREAELQARVDRARVRIATVAAGESGDAVSALRAFSAHVSALALPMRDRSAEIDAECERTPVGGRA